MKKVSTIKFRKSDGGRAAAGFRGVKDDTIRAIADLTGRGYREVRADVKAHNDKHTAPGRKPITPAKGVAHKADFLKAQGFSLVVQEDQWSDSFGVSHTSDLGNLCWYRTGMTIDEVAAEWPNAIVRVRPNKGRSWSNFAAIADGVYHDTWDLRTDDRFGNVHVTEIWVRS